MPAASATSPIDTFRRLAEKPLVRYAVLVLGILACVARAVPVLPFLSSARGVAGPTATDAMHPGLAALALVLGSAACCAVACVVGRIVNAAVGMFVLGCGLAIISGRSGTIVDAAFGGDTLLPIALQTLGWAAAVAAMSAVVFRVSGPLLDMPARTRGGPFAVGGSADGSGAGSRRPDAVAEPGTPSVGPLAPAPLPPGGAVSQSAPSGCLRPGHRSRSAWSSSWSHAAGERGAAGEVARMCSSCTRSHASS